MVSARVSPFSHYLKVSLRYGGYDVEILRWHTDYLPLTSTSSTNKIKVKVLKCVKFARTCLGIFCTGTTELKQLRKKLYLQPQFLSKSKFNGLFFFLVVISYPLVQTPSASPAAEHVEVATGERGLTIERCVMLYMLVEAILRCLFWSDLQLRYSKDYTQNLAHSFLGARLYVIHSAGAIDRT